MVDFTVPDPMEGFQGTDNLVPYSPKPLLPALAERFTNDLFQDTDTVMHALRRLQEEQGVTFEGGGEFGVQPMIRPELIQPNVDPSSLKQQFPTTKGLDQPMPLDVAADIASAQNRQQKQQAAAARYPSGTVPFVLGFGADVTASLLDPVDDAALFIPVVGEARYGRFLAQAGARAGIFGRLGVTLGVGTARGVAAQAPLSALRLGESSAEHTDYTLGNAAWDTLIGGAAGGILHTALAFRGDVLGRRFLESPEGRAAASSAALHDQATRTAAAQMANGLPVDVRPIFDAASAQHDLMGSTAVPRDAAAETRFADAQARANGAPSADAVRWTADARTAAGTPPEAVSASAFSEAEVAVRGMRERGELTAEDEALLAEYETPAQRQPEANAEPVAAASVSFRQGEAPHGWGAIEGEPGAKDGERIDLAPGITAVLPRDVPERYRAVIKAVSDVSRRIVPRAKILAAKRIETEGEHGISGAAVGVNIRGVNRLIAWSLESPNAVGTLRHEAVHFLRGSGLIRDAEWKALERAAQAGDWIGTHDIDARYPGLSGDKKLEEAIAEQFGRNPTFAPPSLIGRAFQRVKDFLSELGARVRELLGRDVSAQDVFRRIESGDIGARVPMDEASIAGPASFQISPDEEARAEQMDAAIAARKKLNAYQDLQKRQALTQAVDGWRKDGLSLENSIDALTRGINTAVKGARDSTAAEQLARQNDFLGQLQHNLDKQGLMTAWRKNSHTAEWVRELFELNSKTGKPGMTGNSVALKIAQAVHAAQDTARLHLNKSGAWIGDYDGYVSRTRHDPYKIDKAGFEAWRDFTLERLDHDRTFAEIDPALPDKARGAAIDKFMSNVWHALSTGIHMSSDHGVGRGKNPAFAGMGNKAKSLSSERVLHWKNADSWREYQQKFADPVIERGVMEGLRRAGSDTALMNRWGTNPAYTFDNLLRTIKERYREDHALVGAFAKAEPRLREEFSYLTGQNTMPVNRLTAQIGGTIRAWQDISKLAFVLFTHMSVGATKPFQLKYHGVGRWQSYTSVLRNLFKDKSPEGRQTIENLRANATGQSQDILSGYEPIDGVPGHVAKLRALSIRLGGLPWMLNRQKVGTEWELSNFLGQRVGSTFDKLHPKTQRALGLYGIGQPEWDVLRNAPAHDRDAGGSTFLTPQAAMRASATDIDTLAAGRIANVGALGTEAVDRIRAETRDKLAMKLASYFSDSADRSTVTPGIPERALFSRIGGKFAGPIIGQYKTWAAAAVRQMWGQAIYGSSKGEAVKALAELVAVGTSLGFLANTAKDVLKGRNADLPNGDPVHDAQILFAAMAKGGGMGIFGDFILGQLEDTAGTGLQRASRLVATVAGPTVSDAARVTGIGFDYLTALLQKHPGKALKNANAEGLRLAMDNLPAVNTFYIRTFANWLILDRLNEMASPGYNARYRARVKQQSGQTFWMPPFAGAH